MEGAGKPRRGTRQEERAKRGEVPGEKRGASKDRPRQGGSARGGRLEEPEAARPKNSKEPFMFLTQEHFGPAPRFHAVPWGHLEGYQSSYQGSARPDTREI